MKMIWVITFPKGYWPKKQAVSSWSQCLKIIEKYQIKITRRNPEMMLLRVDQDDIPQYYRKGDKLTPV